MDVSANSGNVEARLHRDANVKSSLRFQNSVQHWEIGNSVVNNNEFSIYDHNDSRTAFHIDGAGNIGINNSDPGEALDIVGNLKVQGDITAQTLIISSSVTNLTTQFASGSTRFGDDTTDTHEITGSLLVSSSINSTQFRTG